MVTQSGLGGHPEMWRLLRLPRCGLEALSQTQGPQTTLPCPVSSYRELSLPWRLSFSQGSGSEVPGQEHPLLGICSLGWLGVVWAQGQGLAAGWPSSALSLCHRGAAAWQGEEKACSFCLASAAWTLGIWAHFQTCQVPRARQTPGC